VFNWSSSFQFSTPTQSSQPCFSASLLSPTTGRTLNFTTCCRQQSALEPTVAAREIYDALRLLPAAVRIAGPNRARVRGYLVCGATHSGLGGPRGFF